jgi:hypothetical protein
VAFPTVTNSANTTSTSSASLALTMPASIVAGRLLLAVSASSVNEAATTAMTGWTKLAATQKASGAGTLAAFAKIAAGSDTGTVTGSTAARSITTYQIDAWSGVLADIQLSIVDVATLDPPSVTPGFGALDYLWLAAVRNGAAITAAPTNYGTLVTAGSATVVGSAQRNLNASSEDPGVFTGTVATSPVTATIAIKPVAAAVTNPQLLQTPLVPRMRSYNW